MVTTIACAVFGGFFLSWTERLENPKPLVFFDESQIWTFIGVSTRYAVMTASCDRLWKRREQRLEDPPAAIYRGSHQAVSHGFTTDEMREVHEIIIDQIETNKYLYCFYLRYLANLDEEEIGVLRSWKRPALQSTSRGPEKH